ncbi:MAG: class II aldolase/adducin family protein [Promethearchaeota archaeon]
MSPVDLEALKEELVIAAKEVHRRGLVNPGEGNLSARVGRDELLITPSYNQYDTLRPEELVHLKFDGTQLSEGRPASTEYLLHVAVYQARRRANWVVHTHSPNATALSVCRKGIPVLMEEMLAFVGGEVRCAEFGAAHTTELPQRALEALGTNNACLLANHGVLACGRDSTYVVNLATLVEKMATVYLATLQLGGPVALPDEQLAKFRAYFDARATHSRKRTRKGG